MPVLKLKNPDLPAARGAAPVDSRGGRPRSLSGSLQAICALDLLEWLCSSRKSWTLRVWSGGLEGQVVVVQGELLHACRGALQGLSALGEILDGRIGCFDLIPVDDPPPRSLRGHWQSLLLAAAQALDYEPGGEPTRTGGVPLDWAAIDGASATG